MTLEQRAWGRCPFCAVTKWEPSCPHSGPPPSLPPSLAPEDFLQARLTHHSPAEPILDGRSHLHRAASHGDTAAVASYVLQHTWTVCAGWSRFDPHSVSPQAFTSPTLLFPCLSSLLSTRLFRVLPILAPGLSSWPCCCLSSSACLESHPPVLGTPLWPHGALCKPPLTFTPSRDIRVHCLSGPHREALPGTAAVWDRLRELQPGAR